MWLIYSLIGFIIGAILVYTIQKPKIKSVQQLNERTLEMNRQLEKDLVNLTTRKEEILNNIKDLETYAETAKQSMVEKSISIAELQFEQSAEKMAKEYQDSQKEYENEYLDMMKEMAENTTTKLNEYYSELKLLEEKIADKQAIFAAAVEASKRAQEMEDQLNFYRLVLTDDDIMEILKLKEVLPYLRDSEPLNKVIWKVYYEKPSTDMIGRVVGPGVHTGIYKITNIENNMCYVGQAVNIADRWKQHIKRGLGAETPTRNKLYPAMMSFGIENFTFEVIEECDRDLLNSREDYWQEYFHAKDFGYSIK